MTVVFIGIVFHDWLGFIGREGGFRESFGGKLRLLVKPAPTELIMLAQMEGGFRESFGADDAKS